jgi:hypothetical protein
MRHYLQGLPEMFGNKRDYDRLRKEYVREQPPEKLS